jgi:hypothetical protein
MSTPTKPIASVYLVKCLLGKAGLPGAPVASLALLIDPPSHKVTGHVHISQAIQGGDYTGTVEGTIYATGFGNITQVVGLTGSIHPDGPMPLVIAFSANLALNGEWDGTGGFNYGNVHVEDVPVKRIAGQ